MAMQSVQLINTHRTCAACKSTTTDLGKDRCSCGGYMHLIGFVYQPAVRKKDIKAGKF